MSKNKKVQTVKEKRKLKESTKRNWKNIFFCLFRNQSTIEGAKYSPWWIGLILAILGIILPVVPIMVSIGSAYGASLFSSYSYSMEVYNTSTFLDLYAEGYTFKVNNSHRLMAYQNDELASITENVPLAEYISTTEGVSRIEYQLFYSESTSISELLSDIKSVNYVLGTTMTAEDYSELHSDSSTDALSYYRPSFMVLYKNGLYLYLTTPGTTDSISTMSGDWDHFTAGETEIISQLLSAEGYDLDEIVSQVDEDGHYTILRDNNYNDAVFANYKKVLNNSYLAIKTSTFWTYTLVFLAIYLVLVFFMGLMMFLLTRGKKNPLNYYSFWMTTKIAMWASLSPGILALLLGFMITSYATMYFIILYGLRIMWLSMRQLRPQAA